MSSAVPIQHIEIPDIDENKLFEQKGFAGYVEVYEYYISNSNILAVERKAELLNFINMHAMMMKQTDPNAIEEGQLKNIVSLGLDSIFSKKLPQILKETTCLTKEDLLAGGRQFLNYAYNICVGRAA